MSFTQVLNDVTSRIESAVSQNLRTLDPTYTTYQSANSFSNRESTTSENVSYQSSSMSVRLQLDQRGTPFYTNLDVVTGRVILNVATDVTIGAINVKLEGETRTRLSGPKYSFHHPNDPRNKQKIELELHKVLYKVQTVFPSQDVAQNGLNAQFTLPAGQYSYPFSIKIPINNDCMNNSKPFSMVAPNSPPARHIKQTLPPPLSGFPGMAEIKYYVKATVIRPKFYQENIRLNQNIRFQPFEPPRPANRNEETYARRSHQFQISQSPTPKNSISSIFKKSNSSVGSQPGSQPPAIKVEARLPSPAIVSCHQPLPLRLLVEKTNDSSARLYLSLLEIELLGTTHIRAGDLRREEVGTWVLMSQANMNLLLEQHSDESDRSYQVPSRYWDSMPLPNTVTPSFNACNISRSYELEIRIGITHSMSDGTRPELIVCPLRLPVEVYSGITPPSGFGRILTQTASTPNLVPPNMSNNRFENSPMSAASDSHPPQQGNYVPPFVEDPDDLPPSYEDAMAEDIAPVDGPRRDNVASSVPHNMRQSSISNPNRYGSGLNRHGSERLFSQNAPSPPSASTPTAHQTSGSTTREVTDLLGDLNVGNSTSASLPPPLPIRKATADSTKTLREKN